MEMIVIDVWGGPYSMNHLARFIRKKDEAIEITKLELSKGYLINLRCDNAWGPEQEFDKRSKAN